MMTTTNDNNDPVVVDMKIETTTTTTTTMTIKQQSKSITTTNIINAAQRLDTILNDQTQLEYIYTNPIKIIRRWLTTSSNCCKYDSNDNDTNSTNTTIYDIQCAVDLLLHPNYNDRVSLGRTILLSGYVPSSSSNNNNTSVSSDNDNNNMVIDNNTTTTTSSSEDDQKHYVSLSSVYEIECWLYSLCIKTLFRTTTSKHYDDAIQMSFHAIQNTMYYIQHHQDIITTTTTTTTTTSNTTTTTTTTSNSKNNNQYQHTTTKTTLYPLLARLYRYASFVIEKSNANNNHNSNNELSNIVLSSLSQAHTYAMIRRDVDTQATILNCMLRNLLLLSQVEQAHKLLSNTTFPETASNNQYCRYLYYSGYIQVIRLDYTIAFSNLSQSLRKCPIHIGFGFRIVIQRLLIIVQLLMGEIPDRSIFFHTSSTTNSSTSSSSSTSNNNSSTTKGNAIIELQPYLAIATAVRRGDLVYYEQIVKEHQPQLIRDKTYTLILRLTHQVVKAGLRKLHTCYSRISLQQIATKLGLSSLKSAEYVVAKAIRDGVIDATIYHTEQYVVCHDLIDVYATKEPSEAYHRRIAYCLTTHNDAVRGMRYPPDEYKKQLEDSRNGNHPRNKKKSNDDKTDEEKAKEIEDEYDDDY